MRVRGKLVVSVLVSVALAGALAGCGSEQREAEQVASQETQLQEYVEQADALGAEIIAQIPEAEVENVTQNLGGSRQASDLYEDWPKYYYWDQIVSLLPDGPRTPAQLADDLEPWLEEQGWQRDRAREFPPGKESFTRDYRRGAYTLAVEVYTVPPPHAQSISFSIVTSNTDPDRG